MNIYQRINAVMQKVKYVRKDIEVTGGGKYKAVSHDMVLAVLREAMVENGIVTTIEQVSSAMLQTRDKTRDISMHLYSGDYAIHFVNMEKPDEFVKVCVNAHANDSGDKAPGKALSYAVKYAMLKTFGLETGENDEGRMHEDDISDVLEAINSADDMDTLKTVFGNAWKDYPKAKGELTAAYNARKAVINA